MERAAKRPRYRARLPRDPPNSRLRPGPTLTLTRASSRSEAFALEDGIVITLTRLIRAEWMDFGECINGSIARQRSQRGWRLWWKRRDEYGEVDS